MAKQITITHKNTGSPITCVYVFEVVGDLEQPSALKLISINGDHRVSMNRVSGAAYRKAIKAAAQ